MGCQQSSLARCYSYSSFSILSIEYRILVSTSMKKTVFTLFIRSLRSGPGCERNVYKLLCITLSKSFLALRRASLTSNCRPTVILLHPCNVTLRYMIRHSNQCRSNLLAARILPDP
jgi:hypothetical protein